MLDKFKQLSTFKKVAVIVFGFLLVVNIAVNATLPNGGKTNYKDACWCADAMNLPMYVKGSDKYKLNTCNRKYSSALSAQRKCVRR